MSINLDLPLEVNRSNAGYTKLREPRVQGATVTLNYGDDDYSTVMFNLPSGILHGHENNDNPVRLRNVSEEVSITYHRVWFGKQDAPKSDWRYLNDDALYQFDTGKDAAAFAKAHNTEAAEAGSVFRFMVKKHNVMSANHKWREWMQARFDSGEYIAMPWKDEPWYNADHFAHGAMSDGFKVAFVESAIAGADDRMTVVNPGRYLERFYSEVLTPQEIAAWAAKADSEAELCFATTQDEAEDIYVNSGINSCMAYKADSSNFPLGVHPARCYGGGDLAVAYLKRRNKIVARAIVRTDTKVVGRIYGDEERLKNRLLAEGYTYKASDPAPFHGARMPRIEVAGVVVLPYLDWNLGASELDSDFIVMVDKNQKKAKWPGQTQNGTATGESIQICGHNGCRTRITSGQGFYNSSTGRQNCDSCAEASLVRCVISSQYYNPADTRNSRISQVMDRNNNPVTGLRGGYASHHYAAENPMYRIINNVVYLRSETELVPGRARTYRPIAATVTA